MKEGKVESQGICTLFDKNIMDALIQPQDTGKYILQFKYEIADEILIENVGVMVS